VIAKDQQQWQGRLVRVVGFLHVAKEDIALYVTDPPTAGEKVGPRVRNRALWLDFIDRELLYSVLQLCSGQWVAVEGVVSADDHGHWGGFPAALHSVDVVSVVPRPAPQE
jgi:hypothetical protein